VLIVVWQIYGDLAEILSCEWWVAPSAFMAPPPSIHDVRQATKCPEAKLRRKEKRNSRTPDLPLTTYKKIPVTRDLSFSV
jgi:hypothetical protein